MTKRPNQIMLVDDEPRLLSALRRRLSSDYDIVTFESGNAALDYLKGENNVAVIVADMQMPEMNGIELLMEVQKMAPDIRRLMLTGNSDQQTAIAAINDGKVMRFIRKPCDAQDLKKIINHALEDYSFSIDKMKSLVTDQAVKNNSETARRTFLSVMSDELRTPLNQIIGMANVLAKDDDSVSRLQMADFLSQISNRGEHLLSLVDRILQFTKLQSSKPRNHDPQSFDVVELVKNQIGKIEPLASTKRVSVSVEAAGQQSDILGNRDEVSLAVYELISNAVKFNNCGGHVGIIIKSSPNLVALRISDTGPGIPKDMKADLMEAFTQADAGLARIHDGMGLGLALVGSIADQNGLYFDVNDAKSGGTVATLVFKRAGRAVAQGSNTIIELLKAS